MHKLLATLTLGMMLAVPCVATAARHASAQAESITCCRSMVR
jgi:hypothetical protein